MNTLRIGQGWDIHALVEGRALILGGVVIPHTHGLLGHSDADALLHAVIDALLGAAGMGDIGTLFPDTDERFRNADSGDLLREVVRRIRAQGWHIGNVDTTVIAQTPKLAPHRAAMQTRLAQLLDIPPENVNIKAKTAEGFDAVGRREAVQAHAAALLYRDTGNMQSKTSIQSAK